MGDITKFNDKYLKCITTKYLSSIEYLGNSGSLIVYQPASGSQINRNYIYLGNEFLASGYGFSDQVTQIKAENIVKKYDSDLENLSNVDDALGKRITKEVNDLIEKLKEYVAINGGSIENTVITLDGKTINTKDIILYGEEAQYKNLEVNNVEITINGQSTNNGEIFLPIGSLVKEIIIRIDYTTNDSGGIERLQVYNKRLETIDDYSYVKNNKILRSPDYTIVYNDSTEIYNETIETGSIYFTKKFGDDEQILVDKYIDDVLSELYIWVKPTPVISYKNYPQLEQNLGIKLVSSGNAIKSNYIRINTSINIRPQFYMHYGYEYNEQQLCKYSKPLNSFKDFDTTYLSLDLFDITDANKRIFISIPSCFILRKLYIINVDNEKFNLTGSLVMHKNEELPVEYNSEVYKNKYLKYDIYKLETFSSFDRNIKLEIEVIYNNKKDISSIDNDYQINLTTKNAFRTISFDTSQNQVIDEEFNNMYWITFKNDINTTQQAEYLSAFKTLLSTIKYNGIVDN